MSQSYLPQHLMEAQLAQIDLLMAMYPDEGVVQIDGQSAAVLDALRSTNSRGSEMPLSTSITNQSLLLTLETDTDTENGEPEKAFQLEISVPFTYHNDGSSNPDEPPHPKIRLLQPPWMSKADAAALMAGIPQEQDLFTVIEQVKAAVSSHLFSSQRSQDATKNSPEVEAAGPLVRVWFYFPSISTRSKRDDIVNYAPAYGLTGFLLSGKPGVLCLEGPSERVDAYMKFIKTESWGDIPAHHKKVTERLREKVECSSKVFADMQEITETLGERRGERANRGDMKMLEAWLVERGLGDAFMKVLT